MSILHPYAQYEPILNKHTQKVAETWGNPQDLPRRMKMAEEIKKTIGTFMEYLHGYDKSLRERFEVTNAFVTDLGKHEKNPRLSFRKAAAELANFNLDSGISRVSLYHVQIISKYAAKQGASEFFDRIYPEISLSNRERMNKMNGNYWGLRIINAGGKVELDWQVDTLYTILGLP